VVFLSRLAAGQRYDESWTAAYGSSSAELAKAYPTYVDRNELMYWKSAYERPDAAPPQVRRLGVGETHAVWIHLLLAAQGNLDRTHVLAQLDAADAADPAWGARHFWRAMTHEVYDEPGVDALLRQAADADPTDRRSRLAILRRAVAVDGDVGLAALDGDAKVLESGRPSALELAVLGVFWARRGQASRALPFVARAVAEDRGCGYCYEAAALTVFALGKASQAVTYQQRAIDLIERHERAGDATAARERLAKYQAAAGTLRYACSMDMITGVIVVQ